MLLNINQAAEAACRPTCIQHAAASALTCYVEVLRGVGSKPCDTPLAQKQAGTAKQLFEQVTKMQEVHCSQEVAAMQVQQQGPGKGLNQPIVTANALSWHDMTAATMHCQHNACTWCVTMRDQIS
jgi:hypothetical protein